MTAEDLRELFSLNLDTPSDTYDCMVAGAAAAAAAAAATAAADAASAPAPRRRARAASNSGSDTSSEVEEEGKGEDAEEAAPRAAAELLAAAGGGGRRDAGEADCPIDLADEDEDGEGPHVGGMPVEVRQGAGGAEAEAAAARPVRRAPTFREQVGWKAVGPYPVLARVSPLPEQPICIKGLRRASLASWEPVWAVGRRESPQRKTWPAGATTPRAVRPLGKAQGGRKSVRQG
jgi:hypothetical protein